MCGSIVPLLGTLLCTFIVSDRESYNSGLQHKMERKIHGGKAAHSVVFCIGRFKPALPPV